MNRSNSRSGIFLMEIMIAILVFSLTSALCLQMFAKSRQMNGDTQKLSMAVNQTGNVIELMKSSTTPASSEDDFFPDCIFPEYPNAVSDSEKLLIYYDNNWNHCAAETGVYYMEITPVSPEESAFCSYHIEVLDTASRKDAIYSFDVKLHTPNQP